jgi:carbamoyl-phosphate synthase large subunit
MKPLIILTTGAGSPGARGILKSLRIGAKNDNRKIKIITCDMDPQSYGFHLADKAYTIPSGEDSDFIPRILEICKRENPDILFSWVDPELLPLSKNKPKLESLGIKPVISDWKGVETALSKLKTYKAVKDFGCVPNYKVVKNIKEFEHAVHSIGYPENPVCFKPTFSYGMRGFRILKPDINRYDILFKQKPSSIFANLDDILSVFRESKSIPELLVMEYLEGKEYTVDILLKHKKPIITIPRERIRTRQGISIITQLEKNQELIELSEQIAKKLKLDYNINMQFRYSNGKPKLIEVQPRLSGTVIACVGAGANLPYLAAKIVLGETLPPIKIKWRTIVKRFWEEVYIKNNTKWFWGI